MFFDDVKEIANSFCVECVEYLCNVCARDHRRNKATRYHKVLLDAEMPGDPKMFKMMKSLVSCPDHPEMELSFKCKTHEKFICTKCLVVDHRKCDDVLELTNQTIREQTRVTSDTHPPLLEKLQSVNEMTVLVRNAKKDNIKQLQKDSSCIIKERSNYIKSLQKHLLKLDKKSKSETETIVKETLKDLKTDVDRCKKIETEEIELKCLLNVALSYGNTAEIMIICEKVEKEIEGYKDETSKQEMKPVLRLKFDRNKSFEDITSVGIVFVVNSEKEGSNINLSSPETVLELYSDVIEEKTVNAGEDLRSKPLMQCSVSRRRIMYDIQNTTSEVAQKCSITSILILSDGRVVLTEYANKRIKVLNLDFTVQIDKTLSARPIDMCQFSRTGLAIILDGIKCIKYCVIDSQSVTYFSDFYCKLYPISIGSIPGKDDQIVILFSSAEKATPKSSDTHLNEIQIRRMSDGKVLNIFTDFKQKPSLKMTFNNLCRIRMLKKPNAFLLSEDMKLRCVETDNHGKNNLTQKWYFKSHKGNIIAEITDMTVDKEGNIYVCGKSSKNIHQISGINYMNNRVLCTVTGTPLSLCVDDENRQIIVGCEDDDFIYIIKLE